MVFGPVDHKWGWVDGYGFQFPLGIRWCSDEHTKGMKFGKVGYFNSPWELDGVRTLKMNVGLKRNQNFTSPWELDGVRTLKTFIKIDDRMRKFQFPLGIRWCSTCSSSERK